MCAPAKKKKTRGERATLSKPLRPVRPKARPDRAPAERDNVVLFEGHFAWVVFAARKAEESLKKRVGAPFARRRVGAIARLRARSRAPRARTVVRSLPRSASRARPPKRYSENVQGVLTKVSKWPSLSKRERERVSKSRTMIWEEFKTKRELGTYSRARRHRERLSTKRS